MALITPPNRVLETSTTTGTGTYTLAGAVTGYRPASAVCANGATAYYYSEDVNANGVPLGGWETGIGTWSTGGTLARTTIHESSNANAAVNWAAGTRRISLSLTAESIASFFGANISMGASANGTTEGSAVGTFANGSTYGAAIGSNSDGNSSGAAMGYYASGGSGGAAIGRSANGTSDGAALGQSSNGSSSGAAMGRNANGSTEGVAIGSYSSAASYGTALGARASTNSKDKAVALGYYSTAQRYREVVKSADGLATTLRSWSMVDWYGDTTNATATEILLGGTAAQYCVLLNNSAFMFSMQIIAGVTAGGNTSSWTITGAIKRGANAASTALVGTPAVVMTGQGAGAAAWVVVVTADTTNGSLKLTVTGAAATSIRWNATATLSEMRF